MRCGRPSPRCPRDCWSVCRRLPPSGVPLHRSRSPRALPSRTRAPAGSATRRRIRESVRHVALPPRLLSNRAAKRSGLCTLGGRSCGSLTRRTRKDLAIPLPDDGVRESRRARADRGRRADGSRGAQALPDAERFSGRHRAATEKRRSRPSTPRRPISSLLDLMLPKLDGFSVFQSIRARASTPVIMLTARGDAAERIAGLELGADDYVAKPFSPREVVARVQAVLRRRSRKDAGRDGSCSANSALDGSSREVRVRNQDVLVSPRGSSTCRTDGHHPRKAFTRSAAAR